MAKTKLSGPAGPGASQAAVRKRIHIPEDQIQRFNEQYPDFDALRTDALYMLRTLAQRIDDDYNTLLAPYGLTAGRVSYLAVLAAVGENGLPLGELGARVRGSSANVSVTVRSLERDGLVKRLKDPLDGRVRKLTLTVKGKKAIERAFPIHFDNVRTALANVSRQDLEKLAELLDQVAAGFDALMRLRLR